MLVGDFMIVVVLQNSFVSTIIPWPFDSSCPAIFATSALAAPVPASSVAQGLDISFELQNILTNTNNNPGYTYPTSLTRGIVPVSLVSWHTPCVLMYRYTNVPLYQQPGTFPVIQYIDT